MVRMLHALIEFRPVGEARPRRVTHRGRTYVYSPKSKKRGEFRQLLLSQIKEAPLTKAIVVQIVFFYAPLKSWSKKKREDMNGKYKPTRPDLDNLIKFVLDAGNGILWEDDKQVVKFDNCFKCYGKRNLIHITAQELDE